MAAETKGEMMKMFDATGKAFDVIAQAHRNMKAGAQVGKIVVTV
ncbi:hypothetical protein [Burkholderia cepacia]|nr:hypothetical protein [Burkholderia cepacia]